jgi:hypothetical protein
MRKRRLCHLMCGKASPYRYPVIHERGYVSLVLEAQPPYYSVEAHRKGKAFPHIRRPSRGSVLSHGLPRPLGWE